MTTPHDPADELENPREHLGDVGPQVLSVGAHEQPVAADEEAYLQVVVLRLGVPRPQ